MTLTTSSSHPARAQERSAVEKWSSRALLGTPLAGVAIMAFLGPPTALFILALAAALLVCLLVFAYSSTTQATDRLSMIFLWIGVSCFVLTLGQEFVLHGTSLNGGLRDGHFFVASHGHYREVSERIYRLGLLPNLGLLVFWPSLMALGIRRTLQFGKKSFGRK